MNTFTGGHYEINRRFEVAWEMTRTINPSRLVTHRFRLKDASEAYRLLDKEPHYTLQVVFIYA